MLSQIRHNTCTLLAKALSMLRSKCLEPAVPFHSLETSPRRGYDSSRAKRVLSSACDPPSFSPLHLMEYCITTHKQPCLLDQGLLYVQHLFSQMILLL